MRKIKEVLRLHSLELSQRQIATSCGIGQATVSDYLKAAEAAGLQWPDIAGWSDDQVLEAVAPSREKPDHRTQPPEPDYADLRHELQTNKHVTLGEVKQAVEELLMRLNNRPFRKREGSRRSLFESLDKPVLRALPTERYEYGDWETHRVNIDYHVEFDNHWYSVPYHLTQQQVEVRATATTVEIFHRGVRVSSHGRSYVPHLATTIHDHRPKAHQRHLEWTPSRLVDWAKTIGPATAELFDRIIAGKRHPEQGYRSCLGILRLAKEYTGLRVEAAAHRAIALQACSYQSIKSILQCNLDTQAIEATAEPKPPLEHPNLRGSKYYDTGEEPTDQEREDLC